MIITARTAQTNRPTVLPAPVLAEPGGLPCAQDHVHAAAVIGAHPQLAAAEVLVAGDYHPALPGAPLGDLFV
jgi:hypothetical protein